VRLGTAKGRIDAHDAFVPSTLSNDFFDALDLKDHFTKLNAQFVRT